MALWVVDKEKSTLTFSGDQAGTAFHGRFYRFTPSIVFSPRHLSDDSSMEQSHIKVVVDMASAHTGDKVYDGSLSGAEWLHVAAFPEAVFETTKLRATGGVDKEGIENYEAQGKLTLLGISKDIILPFSLKREGAVTHASGDITLKRLDFGIGEKVDSKAAWVGNDIHVRFDVYAHP